MKKRIHRVIAFAIMVSVIFSGFLTACGNSGTSSKTESQKTSIDPNVVYNVIDSPFDRSGENGNSISSEMTEGSEMADDAQISDPSQASDTAKNSGSVDALTDTIPSAEDIASGNIRFNSISEAGDRYYVLYSIYGDETNQYSLCTFDADGKNVRNIPLPVAKNGWVVGMGADPDGGFVMVQSLYEEETQTGSIELLYFSIADDEAQAAENGPQISEKWKQVLEEETLNSNCVVCNGQYTVLISEKAAHIFANDFADAKGVKIADLEKMMKERNLGYDTVIGMVSSEQVLTMVMYFATDKYVDWENMTCSFDSDSFVSVLEFAGRFPAKINYSNVDWDDYETWLLEGKQLVREGFFYNIDSYMEQRYGYVGEEISFMGYLGDGENGPVVETDMLLAMSHASEYKDVCWEFMRSFYLDQYQGNIDFGFPVSKKAYRTMAEKAMQPKTYTYTDENGEEITQEYNNELYINGKSVAIPIAQQKDIDEVTRMIENTDSRAMIDQNISNIINEESGAFFAGQKSAEETARIIQNRVSVYIGEIR